MTNKSASRDREENRTLMKTNVSPPVLKRCILLTCLFAVLSCVAVLRAQSDVTEPGDPVTATSTNYPPAENAANLIDNNVGTKFLNFDKTTNVGFTVIPSHGPR